MSLLLNFLKRQFHKHVGAQATNAAVATTAATNASAAATVTTTVAINASTAVATNASAAVATTAATNASAATTTATTAAKAATTAAAQGASGSSAARVTTADSNDYGARVADAAIAMAVRGTEVAKVEANAASATAAPEIAVMPVAVAQAVTATAATDDDMAAANADAMAVAAANADAGQSLSAKERERSGDGAVASSMGNECKCQGDESLSAGGASHCVGVSSGVGHCVGDGSSEDICVRGGCGAASGMRSRAYDAEAEYRQMLRKVEESSVLEHGFTSLGRGILGTPSSLFTVPRGQPLGIFPSEVMPREPLNFGQLHELKSSPLAPRDQAFPHMLDITVKQFRGMSIDEVLNEQH